MTRESGEHSLSMLLVRSLWALEFCLSFMEVLRGRLCSLLSILLWREGRQIWSNSCQNIMTVSRLHGSRCGDLQSTWETYGFGIQSCRALQQCWLDVQCWHHSCLPPRALAHSLQAPPPEPQKVRAKMDGGMTILTRQHKLHNFLSETSTLLNSNSCSEKGLT